MRFSFALMTMLALSCGMDSPSEMLTPQSQALACDTEPRDNGNGTVSVISYPFEQQYANSVTNGQRLATLERVLAGGSESGVLASHVCSSWLLGTDANGVTVFVNTSDGAVRSHGQVHAGSATTRLPDALPLPIVAQ